MDQSCVKVFVELGVEPPECALRVAYTKSDFVSLAMLTHFVAAARWRPVLGHYGSKLAAAGVVMCGLLLVVYAIGIAWILGLARFMWWPLAALDVALGVFLACLPTAALKLMGEYKRLPTAVACDEPPAPRFEVRDDTTTDTYALQFIDHGMGSIVLLEGTRRDDVWRCFRALRPWSEPKED